MSISRTVVLLSLSILVSLPIALCQAGWEKHGPPVFSPGEGETWDNTSIISSWVIKDGDRYVMWYSANNGDSWGVGRAISFDGINWTRDPPTPVLTTGPDQYDSVYIWGSCILTEDGGYRQYYTGADESNIWTINMATSPDGVNWAKYDGNPVLTPGPSCDFVGDPCVIEDGETYRIWYTCLNRTVGHYEIEHATSPDGIAWTKHPSNPVLIPSDDGPDAFSVRDPCVIRIGDTYEMWYRGITKDWTICHATSSDGVQWIRNPDNPVLTGEPGAWDEKVWFPSVIREDDIYRMWYMSGTTDEAGFAILPIGEPLVILVLVSLPYILGRSRILTRAP
jgi:predicted GH43/DUF377 family glycosyl hydrolase